MTLRTSKQLSPIRPPELSAAARLKQAASSPARPPVIASRDTFEQKPLKSGPALSGTALNAATSPQLKTLGTVAGGDPALTGARLASFTGKDILSNPALIKAGLGTLGPEALGIRGDDAEAASELLSEQLSETYAREVAFGAQQVEEALGPNSPLTPEQQEEYVALLLKEHPELLTESGELPYTDGQKAVYGPETQKLIADTLARAHESGAISDADLREAAATFEDPQDFALLLALGGNTGEVGGPLDVVGQYYQAQAGSTDDPDAASKYRVATALAFTSSEALIAERLPTEEARVKAFSTVALQIDEQFQQGNYPPAQALNAAAQDQFAENATRLFGLAGPEIAQQLSSTTESPFGRSAANPLGTGPKGTEILAQFFAGTLLSPRASELQVDGQPASEVLSRGFEAAYNHLWNQATSAGADSGTQSEAFQKVGVFLGAVDIAAEKVERQALEPEEQSKALQLLAEVLLSAVKPPPGVEPLAKALLDQVLKTEPGSVDPNIEDFAYQYIQTYLQEVEAYENLHPETDANVNVEVGYQSTQIEDQQDQDG